MSQIPAGIARHNRITLLTAMLSMFLLGAIYAYGVLLPDLIAWFGWRNSVANVPQSVLLFVYAVGMGIGGVLQDRLGPTRIALLGGAAFGLGLSLAGHATTFTQLVLSYGVLGGLGFGVAYVSAVTAVMQAFPHRRGLVAGLVVGAFGLGSAIWAPLAQSFLSELRWHGLLTTFGFITLLVLPVLALGIRAPHAADKVATGALNGLTLGESLRTVRFWVVFLAYTLVTSAGLMWLNHYKLYGVVQGISAIYAAWLVAITAIGSGTGRIVLGGLSDRLGRFPTLIGATVLGVILFALLALGVPHLGIFLIAGFIGLVFGTWLALYGPTATDLFGMKAAGAVYGTLYMSYGLGGLLGPTLGGYLADRYQDHYRMAFFAATLLCLGGMLLFVLAAHLQRVVYRHSPAREEEYPLQ